MRTPSIIIALVCSTGLWAQQPGTLDSSFAGIGYFTLPSDIVPSADADKVRFLNVDDEGNALCFTLNSDRLRFFRVLEGGEVDMTFHGGNLDVLASDVALGMGLPFISFKRLKVGVNDGNTYVFATSSSSSIIDGTVDWYMIRLNSELALDGSFGMGGGVILDWQILTFQTVEDLLPLSAGGFLVIGRTGPVFNNQLLSGYCLRTDASINIDPTFGVNGVVLYEGLSGGTWATYGRNFKSFQELPSGGYGLVSYTGSYSSPSAQTALHCLSPQGAEISWSGTGCPAQSCSCEDPSPLLINSLGTLLYPFGTTDQSLLCLQYKSIVKPLTQPIYSNTQPWQTNALYDVGTTDANGGFILIKNNRLGRKHPNGSRDVVFGVDSVEWGYEGGYFTNVALAPPACSFRDVRSTQQGQILTSCRTGPSPVGAVLARYHNIPDPRSTLSLRIFLGGAYDATTGLMRDDLRQQDLLPTLQPYGPPFYPPANGVGPWAVPQHVLEVEGEDAVVDWVWLELINASDSSNVMATRVGLVHRNGTVTSADGHSPIDFSAGAGSYFVRVRHRNHLGVTIAAPLTLGASVTTVDLTDPATTTFGTDAQQEVNGVRMLWPGDATSDAAIKYVGPFNDRDRILVAIGGSNVNAVLPGYRTEDVNLDGVVKYVGTANDRDVILQVLDGSINAVRLEQRP
ncbi:MAG: hypothetical protein IPI81_06080 [Flavobacteriales bacterium]|nr:hypothetical protein [Flavobacteriales bacterium]MCC6937194.1 hypothetical protein [Flavobacteriales bacterium]